jgi:hypothetical protein
MVLKSAVKRLTENDTSATASHQAGFLIPKLFINDGLFDKLSDTEKNPRRKLKFIDLKDNSVIYLNFIYYNNKKFGGTRHEYRLTGLSRWIKNHGLRADDSIQFNRIAKYEYTIEVIKSPRRSTGLSEESWITLYGKATSYE